MSGRASRNPEEKKVTVDKPPVKEMDLVDQVWDRFTKAQDAGPGLKAQDLYCAILLLYNDINKTLRPGPHHDPPTRKDVQKCLKTYERIDEDTTLDREEFNAFFETFTNNAIRRDELQSFFKTGANQQFLRSGPHTEQVNLNSFSGGSHFQIFNFANADMDSLASFVKHIRK